ncbi:hypothetical protein GAZ68_06005 [Phocaeicola vulgatus]|nr:hypothetical protein GAZ68_06005 [Phocaeicola vulgatus]
MHKGEVAKGNPPRITTEPVKPRMEATVNVTCYKSKVLKNGESPGQRIFRVGKLSFKRIA